MSSFDKPTVWIQPGIVAIHGASVDADKHSHHAIQIVWKKQGSNCLLNEESIAGVVAINANVPHQLVLDEGWILLIEPKSELGRSLSEQLGDSTRTFSEIPEFSSEQAPSAERNISEYLQPLFRALVQVLPLAPSSPQHAFLWRESTVKDPRIQQLLKQLNQCLSGDCLKPASWKAKEVATQLALSESRFLHLFSDEMGIAWRPYLLWRRMICAVQAMLSNSSATEAAHLAGFSDSAHLSRTFRRHFGMSIRQAIKLFD